MTKSRERKETSSSILFSNGPMFIHQTIELNIMGACSYVEWFMLGVRIAGVASIIDFR